MISTGTYVKANSNSPNYLTTDLHRIKRGIVKGLCTKFATVLLLEVDGEVRIKTDGYVDSIAPFKKGRSYAAGSIVVVQIASLENLAEQLGTQSNDRMLLLIGRRRKSRIK